MEKAKFTLPAFGAGINEELLFTPMSELPNVVTRKHVTSGTLETLLGIFGSHFLPGKPVELSRNCDCPLPR